MNDLPIKLSIPDGFLEEEVRDGYTISGEMKSVWAVELDLLHELDRICSKHNIQYFACAGTILGAVRHGGFIPWDDDIDVMLLREEYERLCKVAPNEFHFPYFFQTEETDKGTIRGHAQLRNSKTTAILKEELEERYSFNQGIFIDIFPLDSLPDDKDEREKYFSKLKRLRHKSNQFARFTSRFHIVKADTPKRVIRNITGPIISWLCQLFSIDNFWYKKYENYSKMYNSRECRDVGISVLSLTDNRFIWNKDMFLDTSVVHYEFLSIPIPKNYKKMLEITYGDWEIPIKASSGHGRIIFDTHKTYKDYINY